MAEDKRLSGGSTTVFAIHSNAFSYNAANMSAQRKSVFLIGNNFFETPWVIAPSSTHLRDGLGPLFNVNACQSCHFNDGRGHAPRDEKDDVDSLLIRLSVVAPKNHTERQQKSFHFQRHNHPSIKTVLNDSIYGKQLQNRGTPGVKAEASFYISYRHKTVSFHDGFTVSLREPIVTVTHWNYGRPNPKLILSLRIAPPMIGLGLLEAIPTAHLERLADADDQDNDGISGRPNITWDIKQQAPSIGRFGWKAGQPTVKQQTAAAFSGDMGLTTNLFPSSDCTAIQHACRLAPDGSDPITKIEIQDNILNSLSLYARNLAVPARRNINSLQVRQGYQLFYQSGCNACHVERHTTAKQASNHIEQSEQTIYPYTDLLLHDMGPELADRQLNSKVAPPFHHNEFSATTHEWRTPPLWGIGLSKVVHQEATFLHDGRARTLLEAVLWHGGEAQASKQEVLTFNKEKRDALIAFLESL